MGLGWTGAYGAQGAAAALRQLIADRMAAKQQEFDNAHVTAGDQRATEQLGLQRDTLNENTAYRKEQEAARLAEQTRVAGRAEVDDTRTAFNLMPRGTDVTPIKARLRAAGLQPMTEDQPANLASRNIGAGALQLPNDVQERTGEQYGQSSPALPERTTKLPSPQERQQDQTNARADATAIRQDAALTETERYHDAQIAKLGQGGGAADASRMDRSYQASATQLENLRKPVADQIERIARFRDSINQQTPQADAVLAPEVMIIMAGGQGSGVRITQGEIERVTGGRSNLESLKAALNKWSLDPSKALSVTPAQRQQMRQLVAAIAERGHQKLDAITKAHDELIDAQDVTAHRRIVQGARKAFDAITAGPDQPAAPASGSGFRVVGSRPAGGP